MLILFIVPIFYLMQSEHKITLQCQNAPAYKCSVLRTSHLYQSRENFRVLLQMTLLFVVACRCH